ncbi:MAG: biotin--[acetyl-CoA-carboxylase] ligase [Neisseriaceae bacterium]|nr:biotin--[acetyl-CoA-carboxylase] ligase [Neisseriaceae bacterium]
MNETMNDLLNNPIPSSNNEPNSSYIDADALWLLLADAKPHNVADLCNQLKTDAGGINRLRMALPDNVRENLKQGDGFWQLKTPSVVFRERDFAEFAQTEEIPVQIVSECLSTNMALSEQVKTILANEENPYPDRFQQVLVANRQTAGYGKQGRAWVSPAGDSLSFSMSIYARRPRSQTSAMPLVVALSCQKVLRRFGIDAKIKWPNDVMVGDAKIAGILLESIPHDANHICIIGVGLNFNAPELTDCSATGVWDNAPDIRPEPLLKALIHEINRDIQFFFIHGFSTFQTAYTAGCRDIGQDVIIMRDEKTVTEGKVLGVDGTGALLLEAGGEVKKVVSGEVSLRHKNETFGAAVDQMLILDCGNSKIKWAWVVNGEIVGTFKAPYNKLSILGEFCRQHKDIKKIYGSAVCGQMKKMQVAEQVLHRIEWFASEQVACGIRNHYRHTGEHGADRWFNALGARRFTSNACIVVSCGTAITIDALTTTNQYLGGSILPGFNLMKDSLSKNTANLDRPFGRIYPFATTTPNAIASGIMDAVVGALILMYDRLVEKEEGLPVDIILTGGGSSRIYHHLPPQFSAGKRIEMVENLVIYGLLSRIEQR